MNTRPSDEILLKYASRVLDPALHLLVERHMALAPETAEHLDEFQALGGLMLAAEPAVDMTAGSLDRALARIDARINPAPTVAWPELDSLKWRWAGPGRSIAPISIDGSAMRAYALRIAPGKSMARHSHASQEWTLIVQGSFSDESGDYHVGAFIEEDGDTLHTPRATGDIDCICLAVISGPLTAPGMMGRLVRYFMR